VYIRDMAVDILLSCGDVYEDEEYAKEFIQERGAKFSKNAIIEHLEERLVDVAEEDVEKLLNKIDDRQTLRKLIKSSRMSNFDNVITKFKNLGFEESDIAAAFADIKKSKKK